jgi:hypothetical protein
MSSIASAKPLVTQGIDLTARETEIIRIIRILYATARRFVVIGGYAVNALTAHRFSVDCDLVISQKDLDFFETRLEAEGYKRGKIKHPKGAKDFKTVEFVKSIAGNKVKIQFFMNGMLCRQTMGKWSYTLISRGASVLKVIGGTDSTDSLVPSRELLLAMKLHSGRPTDLRDLVMLHERVAWNKVAHFANTGNIHQVLGQIDSATVTIAGAQFVNEVMAAFGSQSSLPPRIRETIKHLQEVKKLLEE